MEKLPGNGQVDRIFMNLKKKLTLGATLTLSWAYVHTRVVPKVPLHSLVCHNNSMSELTTLIVTKYYILGLWGQILVLLRIFVKTQRRFEPVPLLHRSKSNDVALIVMFFLNILLFG